MSLTIDVVAREDSSALRNLGTTPSPDAQIAAAFTYAERGVFQDASGATHSRTAATGGWIGALAITRHADGTAEAQRTWGLTDAQQATAGLTTTTAVQQFAQRLASDVHVKLLELANRGTSRDHWIVVAGPRAASLDPGNPPVVPPGPNPLPVVGMTGGPTPESSNGGVLLLIGGVAVAGLAAAIYASRK